MCERGGGGLSISVMEELLLFPAKSEEQRQTSGGGEEAQETARYEWGRVTTTHTHAQVHNVQQLPSPTACTATPRA